MNALEYEDLAARAFDEPYDALLRAELRVCSDELEQAGDPRGPLIALEHAALDEPPRRARELRRAMDDLAFEHGAPLLGALTTPVLRKEVAFEWRAGRIYGASVDTRRLAKLGPRISPAELVDLVLDAPAAHALRRLRVRMTPAEDHAAMLRRLCNRGRRPPLEELEIGTRAAPSVLRRPEGTAALEQYPDLYLLALRDAIHPPRPQSEVRWSAAQRAAQVSQADPPTTAGGRAVLGRALLSNEEPVRAAALARIATSGRGARCFARVMTILLQPGIVAPQLPIIEAMRALGGPRELARVLARISSRPHYDAPTRSAAGAASAAIRAAPLT